MIPYLIAAIGGYLIGDSMKESQTFAKGGETAGIAEGDKVDWNGERAYIESIDGNKVKLFINHPESHNNGKVYSRDKHFVVDIEEVEGKKLSRHRSKPFDYDEFMKEGFARGGKTKTAEEDMSVQFIDYKDKTIMFEPHFKQYFTNDIEFKTLAEAKRYIDAGSPDPSWEKFVYSQGIMADGGSVEDRKAAIVKRRTEINDETNKIAPRGKKMKAADRPKMEALQKEYKDLGREWNRLNGDDEEYAKGGPVTDGYVVYFGVFRGRGLTPVITEYHESLEDAEKSVEQKKAKKEKGWKVKALDKMPVSSEVRMGRDNANYNKVKEAVHSEEKVTEFFKDKDSFYKKDYSWVKPDGYEWDNWQLKKK